MISINYLKNRILQNFRAKKPKVLWDSLFLLIGPDFCMKSRLYKACNDFLKYKTVKLLGKMAENQAGASSGFFVCDKIKTTIF